MECVSCASCAKSRGTWAIKHGKCTLCWRVGGLRRLKTARLFKKRWGKGKMSQMYLMRFNVVFLQRNAIRLIALKMAMTLNLQLEAMRLMRSWPGSRTQGLMHCWSPLRRMPWWLPTVYSWWNQARRWMSWKSAWTVMVKGLHGLCTSVWLLVSSFSSCWSSMYFYARQWLAPAPKAQSMAPPLTRSHLWSRSLTLTPDPGMDHSMDQGNLDLEGTFYEIFK